MWKSSVWKKVFVKDENESLSNLCKIGNTVWKQNMVFEKKRSGKGIEKNWKRYDETKVLNKADW